MTCWRRAILVAAALGAGGCPGSSDAPQRSTDGSAADGASSESDAGSDAACAVRMPNADGEFVDEGGMCRMDLDAFGWCAPNLRDQLGDSAASMQCQRCTLGGATVVLVACPVSDDVVSCYYRSATGAVVAGAHDAPTAIHCGSSACRSTRVSTESVVGIDCDAASFPCSALDVHADAGADAR